MLTALIMAGGKGTRFWPLSTEEKPKQFLSLIGDETMIQMTVNRIKSIIPIERIFICTANQYISLVKEQLPELPDRNIIIEPEGRNTAPAIALSALVINKYYKESKMVVLPSDHLIAKEESFREIIISSEKFLNEKKEAIVTLGMKPNRPETGYGYIKYEKSEVEVDGYNFMSVESFVEKPNVEKAKEYLANGRYLWNGGVFIWSINTILDQLKKYATNTYEVLQPLESVEEKNLQGFIDSVYNNTEAISIDYAVLEKSKDIYVIPSNIDWDDIGSWEALERYKTKDNKNNISMGNIKCLNAENNIIISDEETQVIINGISDIYVIQNGDKLIIGKKSNLAEIKELSALYKKK